MNPDDAETYYQRAAMFKMVSMPTAFSRLSHSRLDLRFHRDLNKMALSVNLLVNVLFVFFISLSLFFFFKRGDLILALEDYKIAAKLLPSKTDAMFEIGLFRFQNE